MRELECLKIELTPAYFLTPRGAENGELRITINYKGEERHFVEKLWASDAMSVVDYVWDRAKHYLDESLKEEDL